MTALAVGIQYCRVALWDIPQHSYYGSPKYQDLKHESAKCALEVSDLLPVIVQSVSKELQAKGQNRFNEKLEEVSLLNQLSKEHYHSIVSLSPISLQAKEIKKEVLEVDEGFPNWLKALDCGDNLDLCVNPGDDKKLASVKEDGSVQAQNGAKSSGTQQDGRSPRDKLEDQYKKSEPIEFSRTSSAPAHLGKDMKDRVNSESREPPPTIEEIDVQYQIAENESKEIMQYESDLERALYLSGLEFQTTSQDTSNQVDRRYQYLKPVGSDVVALQTLSQLYRDDFEDLRKSQMIKVSYLETFQGRVKGSVNGCTVIAPLLAIHHLCDDKELEGRNWILNELREPRSMRSFMSTGFGNGIEDELVRVVIDTQAPLLLPQVREKLGLPDGALIIPSDVHDYLIEENFLSQQHFSGVFGGNILDDGHLSQFVDFFASFGRGNGEGVESRKVAATFFFHEHVISLLRITRRIQTSLRYQEIPKVTTKKEKGFFKKFRNRKNKDVPETSLADITTIIEEENWFEIIDSLPSAAMLNNDEDREQQTEEECYSHLPVTARIRCKDKKSLHAALRWYACSKFTPDDQKFIDSYQWDDKNMEFDSRVFQGFVWAQQSS